MALALLSKEEAEEQIRKNPPQDLSEVEADRHGEGVDLIAAFTLEPVAGTDFTVVLAMANDRFDGIATLLASFHGQGDVAFLSGKNDLGLIVCEPMAAITQINIDFLRHCPRKFFDLPQNRRQRASIIGPAVMGHGSDNEVAGIG